MQDWSIEYEIIDRMRIKRHLFSAPQTSGICEGRETLLIVPFWSSECLELCPQANVPNYGDAHRALLQFLTLKFKMALTVCQAVSRILGKDVTGFRRLLVDSSGRVVLLTGKTKNGHRYSEFHFGAGESSVIRMVSQIELAAEQTLVLIEEIENGLHPVATVRMVEYLVETADRKKI